MALFLLLFAVAWPVSAQQVMSLLEMRQENVVIQKWDLSCGAAALTTLLDYQHGENLTEKEVAMHLMKREEYIRDPSVVQRREGFSLRDLKRYVDDIGYKGIAYGKLGLKELEQMAPIMVPIKTRGYNHFVIVRGMRGNRILIADSAWGNRTMLISDFMDGWINYPEIGHVGFIVAAENGDKTTKNLLQPRDEDFVFLK